VRRHHGIPPMCDQLTGSELLEVLVVVQCESKNVPSPKF